MVKIAIAGPGQLAREIIDGLVATGKHEILILSRKDATPKDTVEGTTWVKVDYEDKSALVQALQGVHTVLSFIVVHLDLEGVAQRTLIDAAIEAGVKRIAPSEWAIDNISHLSWYDNKIAIRKYLEEKNKDKKVIEYSLFQPGWYLNYLAGARKTAKNIEPATQPLVDVARSRALVSGDLDRPVSYTTVLDIVNIVVKAVEYDAEWPTVGGFHGNVLSSAKILALAEKIGGKPLNVEVLDPEDLKAGVVKSSWLPEVDHPSVANLDEATKLQFSKLLVSGMLLNQAEGAGLVSDEWNQIFPDYKFVGAEEFLTGVWTEEA